MSENKKIIEADSMPKDAKLTLVVDSIFYYRFNQFLFDYMEKQDPEKVLKMLENIKNNQEPDRETAHFRTILAFQVLMEETAKEQGLIKRIKIDKETGETIEEENPQDSQSQSQPVSPN